MYFIEKYENVKRCKIRENEKFKNSHERKNKNSKDQEYNLYV